MRFLFLGLIAMLLTGLAAAQPPVESQIEAPGPLAPLKATMLLPAGGAAAPIVLIIPGSGPTDRDGNSPLGVRAQPYRLLAEALAARGIGSVRIDKRGMFASKPAIASGNDATVADYAGDVHAWAKVIRAKTGVACVWVLGHSEGGLVTLAAAQDPAGLCGIVLVATAGRPLGEVMRAQLKANPALADAFPSFSSTIDAFEAGRRVDTTRLPQPIPRMFPPQVQGLVISLFAPDPVTLARAVRLPTLIVQGERDAQISVADAQALKAACSAAKLVLLPGVNHVLKTVDSDDRRANIATYADPTLPLAPGVADAVAGFVKGGG